MSAGIPIPVIPAPPIPATAVQAKPTLPDRVQQSEEETPPPPLVKQKKSRGGRVATILLVIFALLAAIGAAAYSFLRPYLRYRAAVEAQLSGDYDTALKLYEELGDYKDSAQRITQSELGQAVAEINRGNYQTALDMLEGMENVDEEKAKCYYSLAVLAHNDGELEKAWGCIEQLKAVQPDYPELPTLEKSCYYAEGLNCFHAAEEETRLQAKLEQYRQAIQYFNLADDYERSREWTQECKYQSAAANRELANDFGLIDEYLGKAIDGFSELEDYKDSRDRLLESKMYYALYHLDTRGEESNDLAMDYLTELIEAGYPGAQELFDRINGSGFAFTVIMLDDNQVVTETNDLSQLRIAYEITARNTEGEPVPVLLHCTLPDGTTGSAFLNQNGESSGWVAWADIFPVECTEGGEIRLELYDLGRSAGPVESFTLEYRLEPPAPGENEGGGNTEGESHEEHGG